MKNFRTIWLAIIAFMMITVTSCSNHEDYFGLDVENKSNVKRTTRTSCIDCSEYLTISAYDLKEMTEKDLETLDNAISRMGISVTESPKKYIYEASCGKEINISDSLYTTIVKMIDNTNRIFADSDILNQSKVTRMKSRAAEPPSSSPSTLYDCVPAAISHMGRNAPSYEAVIKKCDELYPKWRTDKGILLSEIESLIRYYIPVSMYRDLSYFTIGSHFVPNYVTVFGFHAVNAYRISKTPYISTNLIHYYDYSSTAKSISGFIFEEEMTCIYIF